MPGTSDCILCSCRVLAQNVIAEAGLEDEISFDVGVFDGKHTIAVMTRDLLIEVLLVSTWRGHAVLHEGLLLGLMMPGLGSNRLLRSSHLHIDWLHKHVDH